MELQLPSSGSVGRLKKTTRKRRKNDNSAPAPPQCPDIPGGDDQLTPLSARNFAGRKMRSIPFDNVDGLLSAVEMLVPGPDGRESVVSHERWGGGGTGDGAKPNVR